MAAPQHEHGTGFPLSSGRFELRGCQLRIHRFPDSVRGEEPEVITGPEMVLLRGCFHELPGFFGLLLDEEDSEKLSRIRVP